MAQTDNPLQIRAIASVLEALNIKFEIAQDKKSSYDSDFVEMVLEAEQEIKAGKEQTLTSEEFDALKGHY